MQDCVSNVTLNCLLARIGFDTGLDAGLNAALDAGLDTGLLD